MTHQSQTSTSPVLESHPPIFLRPPSSPAGYQAHSAESLYYTTDSTTTDPRGIPAVPQGGMDQSFGSAFYHEPQQPSDGQAVRRYEPVASKRQRILVTAGVAVLAAAVVAGGVAVGYQNGKNGSYAYYQPRNASLSSQVASLSSQAAALQADKVKTSADAAAVPDLAAIAAKYPGMEPLNSTATSLEVTFMASDPQTKINAIYSFMTELGFTDAVLDRMGKTRALDGTLTAQGRNCNVSWTYHPDNGLQMVFEAKAA